MLSSRFLGSRRQWRTLCLISILKIQFMLQIIREQTSPERVLTKLDESILEKASRLCKFITCMSDSCIMCQHTRNDEGLMRWYNYEEDLWKVDEPLKRSAVAPLKRCSGKPLIKIRDHHILKKNRLPHFTVLCLVRDAAARLPEGVGTRADIFILVRDSQFIVEDISYLQVSQVVSGALVRLHYENDLCARFDKEWHLWAYLHGDRQEEDFEYDSTFSNKSR